MAQPFAVWIGQLQGSKHSGDWILPDPKAYWDQGSPLSEPYTLTVAEERKHCFWPD